MRTCVHVLLALAALMPAAAQAGVRVATDTVVIEQTRTVYANRFVQGYGGFGPPGGAVLAEGPEIDLYWYPSYRVRTIVTAPVDTYAPSVEHCYPVRMQVRHTWRAVRLCE